MRKYFSAYYDGLQSPWQPLAKIKAKNKKLLNRHQPSPIDTGISQTLLRINALPCVVNTIESCSSHFSFLTKLPPKIEALIKRYLECVQVYFSEYQTSQLYLQYLNPRYALTFALLASSQIQVSKRLMRLIEDDDFLSWMEDPEFSALAQEDRDSPWLPEIANLCRMIWLEKDSFWDIARGREETAFLALSLINDHPLSPILHRKLVNLTRKYQGKYDYPHLQAVHNVALETVGDPEAICSCGCGQLARECDAECETCAIPYRECSCPKQKIAYRRLRELLQEINLQTSIRYFFKVGTREEAISFWKQLDRIVSSLGTRRNPLDTSGIICDFCGQPNCTNIYTCSPFMLGNIPRAQFMTCAPCAKLIDNRDIVRLSQQAVKMLPAVHRDKAKVAFSRIYKTFFNNLLNGRLISLSDIFELAMLRARAKHDKCELGTGHPTMGACNKLAYLVLKVPGGSKKTCQVCAAQALGLNDLKSLILHPDLDTLY